MNFILTICDRNVHSQTTSRKITLTQHKYSSTYYFPLIFLFYPSNFCAKEFLLTCTKTFHSTFSGSGVFSDQNMFPSVLLLTNFTLSTQKSHVLKLCGLTNTEFSVCCRMTILHIVHGYSSILHAFNS